MSLKAKLDEHRAGFPSRFTEEQRRVMGRFQDAVAAAERRLPRVGDLLPPLSMKGAEELQKGLKHLALVFFRGAW